MLKLWPNWFQPLSRTPDPGITHLCWRSVVHWAKGSHHPKTPGQGIQERRGWPRGGSLPFPLVFSGREEPRASPSLVPISMHDSLSRSSSRLRACKKLTSKPWKGGNGKCWREISH